MNSIDVKGEQQRPLLEGREIISEFTSFHESCCLLIDPASTLSSEQGD